jgi:hypothetical protein
MRRSVACMPIAVLALTALSSGGCAVQAAPSPNAGGDAGGPGAGGPLGFVPSNVDLSGVDLTALGDFVVDNDECTIDTDNLLASCGDGANQLAFKVATQADGTLVAVYLANSMSILAGQNLTVTGSRPLVFVALGAITIAGTLDANGKSGVGTGGGPPAQMDGFTSGLGAGGGAAGSATTGGGGGSYCGTGGVGGAESGTAPASTATYGTREISPLAPGSSGGAGSGTSGSGGGAIQLVAGASITVLATGVIQAGGGGGGFGGVSGQEANGGGSGGSLLLESLVVTVAGTLAVNGGGGGAGTDADVGGAPPLDPGGADSTPGAAVAAGGKQGIGPSSGGDGSGGATIVGSAGSFTLGNAAGGGGGGAGRIRINTSPGNATLDGATISPDMSTPCATLGTVQ